MNIRSEDNVKMMNGVTCTVAVVNDNHFICTAGHKHLFDDVISVNGTVYKKVVNKSVAVEVKAVIQEKAEVAPVVVEPVVAVKKKSKSSKKVGLDLNADGVTDVIVSADVVDLPIDDMEIKE